MATPPANVPVSPASILQLSTMLYQTRILLSAVELGLFTLLTEGPATEAEIRQRLALHPRASRDFLDALVAVGMVEREADRYRNSPPADFYLDRRKPSYLGTFVEKLASHYPVWERLTEALRTGQPQMRRWTDERWFNDLYQDSEAARDFMARMDIVNARIGPALARSLDWSGYDSFIDVGGARGNVAAALVKAHPHLRGGCFDLPQVEPLFNEHIAALGLTDQVRFYAGDFFDDSLPEVDVLIFGHVLHNWDPAERQMLLKKAYASIPVGGVLLVYDPMINDDRRGKLVSLLMSLKMLLITPGGSEYTIADCRSWLQQAGFDRTSAAPLTETDTLIITRKDH
ncbi:MAG: methyltransferase [Egibacteraceae bacterium]